MSVERSNNNNNNNNSRGFASMYSEAIVSADNSDCGSLNASTGSHEMDQSHHQSQRGRSPMRRSSSFRHKHNSNANANANANAIHSATPPSINRQLKRLLCTRATNSRQELKSIDDDHSINYNNNNNTWESMAAQYTRHYQEHPINSTNTHTHTTPLHHDLESDTILSLEQKVAALEHQRTLLDLELRALSSTPTDTQSESHNDGPTAPSIFLQLSPQQQQQQPLSQQQQQQPSQQLLQHLSIPKSPNDSSHNKLTVSTHGTGSLSGSFNSHTNTNTNTHDHHQRIIKQQQAEIEALRRQIASNLPVSVIETGPFVDDATSLTSAVLYNNSDDNHNNNNNTDDGGDDDDDSSTTNNNDNNNILTSVEEMEWTLDPPSRKNGWYSGSVNRNMVPHGQGKLQFQNGDVYEGPFEDGQIHGMDGLFVWASGDIYRGGFERNLRHGHGELRLKQVGKYIGNFEIDQQHGYGIHYNMDGTVYHRGQWECGRPSHRMVPFIGAEAFDETSFSSDQILLAADLSIVPREDAPYSRYAKIEPYLQNNLHQQHHQEDQHHQDAGVTSSEGSTISYNDGVTEESSDAGTISMYSSLRVPKQGIAVRRDELFPYQSSGPDERFKGNHALRAGGMPAAVAKQERMKRLSETKKIPPPSKDVQRTIHRLNKKLAKLEAGEKLVEGMEELNVSQIRAPSKHVRDYLMGHF